MKSLSIRNYSKDVNIISGLPKSGKSVLAPLISTILNSDTFSMDSLIESFNYLHWTNNITTEGFKYLLNHAVNQKAYNTAIGREINFRFDDETSIFKTNNPAKHFQKIYKKQFIWLKKKQNIVMD